MKKRLLKKFTGLLVALIMSILPVCPALGQYTITDLGILDGIYSRAYGINNLGQVVGRSGRLAFLWENGVMTDLGNLGEGEAIAYGINDSCQVVGTSILTGLDYHAFLWEDGVMTDIWGSDSYGKGINDPGQVVGFAFTGPAEIHAFLWEDGVTTDLGNLGGKNTQAHGINDCGQVAGYGFTGSEYHAFLWENGVMTDLGTLGGDHSRAFAINNLGQVVGRSYIYPGDETEEHAFLCEDGVMTDLGTLGGNKSGASAINDSGQVVGRSGDHAFVWKNGTMYDLNDLIPADSRWELTDATGINEMGQIVGYGIINGQEHAFLLMPVPEPDIKANASDGPLIIPYGTNLIVTVALAPRGYDGEDADWWVAAKTPFGRYWYTLNNGWVRSDPPIRVYGGPLFDLPSREVLNNSGLPIGIYKFHFGVDMLMNGSLDFGQLYYNSVDVTITLE